MISELREEPQHARTLAELGDLAGVMHTLDQALAGLNDSRLATADAETLLGVRAPIVLQALMRIHGVRTEGQDDTLLVPLWEVVRIDPSEWVQRLRTLAWLQDLSSDLGGDKLLTQEELDALETNRPGKLPGRSTPDREGRPA